MNKIRNVEIKKDSNGTYQSIQVIFGTHYFLDITYNEINELTLYLGATHHGFKARAVEVMDELEQFIYEIRENHPNNVID